MWRIYNEILALECLPCSSSVCRRGDAHNSAGVSRITINKFRLLLFIPSPNAKFQSRRIFAQWWIIEKIPCFLLLPIYLPCGIVCGCEWNYGLHTGTWNLEISTNIDENSIEKLRKNECEKPSTNWQLHELYRRECSPKCFLKYQLKSSTTYHWFSCSRFSSNSDCISSSLVFLALNVYSFIGIHNYCNYILLQLKAEEAVLRV